MDFFLPAWVLNIVVLGVLGAVLLLLLVIVKANFLSLTEKLLMIIAIFTIPVLGWILALYFWIQKRKEKPQVTN